MSWDGEIGIQLVSTDKRRKRGFLEKNFKKLCLGEPENIQKGLLSLKLQIQAEGTLQLPY